MHTNGEPLWQIGMSSASGYVVPSSNPGKGENLFGLKRNNFEFEFVPLVVSIEFSPLRSAALPFSFQHSHFITSKSNKTFLKFTLLNFVLSTVQHTVAKTEY